METYLAHHGILGQKWGIRRFQNEDGTLTEIGKQRYGSVAALNAKRASNRNAAKAAQSAAVTAIGRNAVRVSTQDVAMYASVARAAATVASLVTGVGAVATISYGVISAGQLAYSAYLKNQAKKNNGG